VSVLGVSLKEFKMTSRDGRCNQEAVVLSCCWRWQ